MYHYGDVDATSEYLGASDSSEDECDSQTASDSDEGGQKEAWLHDEDVEFQVEMLRLSQV